MSVLNPIEPSFFPPAGHPLYQDAYVKMMYEINKKALLGASAYSMFDGTVDVEVQAPRPAISEMKATLALIDIVRGNPDTVGVMGALQEAGRRCIMGELAYRLGLLDEIAKKHDHNGRIGGSSGIVITAMGGRYSHEFEHMLHEMVGMNDSGITWGKIGERFGLAA